MVNPDDDRYKGLIGRTAITPIFGNEVPITAHKSVDMAFGTGAVMICSYGDYHDVQLIREFRLKEIVAIDIDGKMTSAAAGSTPGMSIKDARSQIIQDLQESKVAAKVEQIQHGLRCARGATPPSRSYRCRSSISSS